MAATTLELFFVDGDPEGVLTAQVFNWTGHVLSAPRLNLISALKRDEASFTGAYVLVGERDGADIAYVGQGENIAERIRSHDAKKDWWERVVWITTSSNSLNKAHAQYLEARLVQLAKASGRFALDNGNAPSIPSIGEAATANMEAFLDQLLPVLRAIRIDVFADSKREAQAARPNDLPEFELTLKKEGIKARAIIQGNEFVVQKGSAARREWIGDRKDQTHYWKLHDKLVGSGVLELSGNNRIFTESYAFTSTSAAGAVVTGRSTAGPIAWKIADTGITYKQWEAKELLSPSEAVSTGK